MEQITELQLSLKVAVNLKSDLEVTLDDVCPSLQHLKEKVAEAVRSVLDAESHIRQACPVSIEIDTLVYDDAEFAKVVKNAGYSTQIREVGDIVTLAIMQKVECEILLDGVGETRYQNFDVPVELTTTDAITSYIEENYDITVSKLYGIGWGEN